MQTYSYFLVANILKEVDQKNQVAAGKCGEAYYEVCQVITVNYKCTNGILLLTHCLMDNKNVGTPRNYCEN